MINMSVAYKKYAHYEGKKRAFMIKYKLYVGEGIMINKRDYASVGGS